MPQMNPMNWFLLFLFFNSSLFLLALKNFYFCQLLVVLKHISNIDTKYKMLKI